ncbi:patatin-like phospholipase family protein [Terriglobus albidus]|uniref:patatin-like phospholipase family protein n=1 Tax=Terriglobus albidus TaxID=1592106 RepID=UPI0021DFF7D3|nr:patatin-like phospholipase family protein [Terriglobus albidus]
MRKRSTVAALLTAALCTTPLSSQTAVPTPQPERKKIGLALGGGGALGLTEIGVLRWLEEHHIPVDGIAGASMGALIGGLYATGHTPDEIQQLTTDEVLTKVFRLSNDFSALNYRRREDRRSAPNYMTIGLKHGISIRNGLLVDAGLNAFLSAQFLSYGDKTSFDQLSVPFRCTATDITEGKPVVFARGSLPESIRASIALPGIFPPVQRDGHTYVDGGVLENLPTQTLKSDLHDDVILAVSMPLTKLAPNSGGSLLGTLQRSFSVAIWGNELQSRRLADVVIEPQTGDLTVMDYGKAVDLVKLGYDATEAQKDKLMAYTVSDTEWAAYLASRASRTADKPRNIASIKVETHNHEVKEAVEHKLQKLVGQPAEATVIDKPLDELRADERYEATYQVSYPSGPIRGVRDADITVKLTDKENGPPFILIGINGQAQSGQTPRFTLDLTYLHQDFGRYGSELRGTVELGWLQQFDLEYYRLLNTRGLFLAPHGEFTRRPYFIYHDQDRLSERLWQRGGGGVDLGYTFSHNSELRAGWQAWSQRWVTKTGNDGQGDSSQVAHLFDVRYAHDGQDRAEVAQRGFQYKLGAGYLKAGEQAAAAPRVVGEFQFAHTIGGNTFLAAVEGGTLFNRDVAQPYRFTLGGPGRLSASAFEEYRGTDYFYLREAYLRRIAKLPDPLGQNIYLAIAYEAGQMRAPRSIGVTGTDYAQPVSSFLRQDVMFGVLAETPLGVISFGPAIGDAGRRKLSFTIGRSF